MGIHVCKRPWVMNDFWVAVDTSEKNNANLANLYWSSGFQSFRWRRNTTLQLCRIQAEEENLVIFKKKAFK